MNYQHLSVEVEDGIATVTMCRAHRRNSLSEDHLRELLAAFESIGKSNARGVILAAEGPVFSSGHDFNDMAGRDLDGMKSLLETCGDFMQLIQRMPQPVIAQVEGLATAAGCQLVASCDLAVAGESTRFQAPGGFGGWFCHTPGVAIVRAVGRKRALEMLLTGDPIDAHTAAEVGTGQPGRTGCGGGRRDTRVARSGDPRKHLIRRRKASEPSMPRRISTRRVRTFTPPKSWPRPRTDGQETMRAFVEKRRPNFVGRDTKKDRKIA